MKKSKFKKKILITKSIRKIAIVFIVFFLVLGFGLVGQMETDAISNEMAGKAGIAFVIGVAISVFAMNICDNIYENLCDKEERRKKQRQARLNRERERIANFNIDNRIS